MKEELQKRYAAARQARDAGRSKAAARRYRQVLPLAPADWEAYFFANYFEALRLEKRELTRATAVLCQAIGETLFLIRDHVEGAGAQRAALETVCRYCLRAAERFQDAAARPRFSLDIPPPGSVLSGEIMDTLIQGIEGRFPYLPGGAELVSSLRDRSGDLLLRFVNSRLEDWHRAKAPPQQGCYIATAVYGSYDCPQVRTLRRFRDAALAKTPAGRAFIRVYYALSPALARRLGQGSWLSALLRLPLDALVRRLQAGETDPGPCEDEAP